VHGVDNRVQVTNTTDFPYRVNASLLITARDGSQWIGTGWFISARTLITAGHCVYITNSGVAGRDGWVKSIQ
jgi:V8-like Glu-specific endopeptidase